MGRDTGQFIDVECLDSNEELARIVAKHGHIDLLKVDIETLERIVTERIPINVAAKIRHIVVEYPFTSNPLSATHTMKLDGATTRFWRQA